ncbi:MFS transporter [Pontibacillus litoralis JSM 072002]|uniref:Bcr/CflA family efflux transporter n=1 Tax=Pontibacillus litoralis JSM 072002 TaxID=1385512 RepID=A0A0A5HQ78_9BACI|nr:MFS transporter [Pontibacillus litoralis JSM 072002]
MLILGSLSAFGPLTIDMYLPGLPSLAQDLHTSASIAQLSLTACLIGLALGQIVVGPMSDIQGRKKPLILALSIYTVSSLWCVFSTSIWGFIGLRFIQGLSGAAGMVISRASARDLFSGTELTKFYSMLMLVNGLAPILAPVVGGQLLQFMSWRGVFGVLAAIGALMLIVIVLGLKETLPVQARKTGGVTEVFATFGLLLKDRVFVGYALSQGFIMSAMFAYISGSTFVLQDIYGLSPQMFSVVFAINGVGLILATQITGRLSGVIHDQMLLIYGILQAVISSLLLIVIIVMNASVVFVCIMLFLTISSVGIVNTTVFSLAMENQSNHAGSASALLGLLPFLLGAAVAPLVGIGDGTTALPMALVIAGCNLIAFGVYMFLIRRR